MHNDIAAPVRAGAVGGNSGKESECNASPAMLIYPRRTIGSAAQADEAGNKELPWGHAEVWG